MRARLRVCCVQRRHDYVTKVSSANLAHNIGVPTLALNAHDDPICPSSYVPHHTAHAHAPTPQQTPSSPPRPSWKTGQRPLPLTARLLAPLCRSVPVRVVEDNENIIFGLTDRGGHLAWLEGWDFWEEVHTAHDTQHDTTRHATGNVIGIRCAFRRGWIGRWYSSARRCGTRCPSGDCKRSRARRRAHFGTRDGRQTTTAPSPIDSCIYFDHTQKGM